MQVHPVVLGDLDGSLRRGPIIGRDSEMEGREKQTKPTNRDG